MKAARTTHQTTRSPAPGLKSGRSRVRVPRPARGLQAHIVAVPLLCAVLAGCGATASSPIGGGLGALRSPSASSQPTVSAALDPTITVDPLEGPIDSPVSIRVAGLAPESEVDLRLRSVGTAFQKDALESLATFRADRTGRVDVTTQAPIRGSYTTVDPMGLFWSMTETRLGPGASAPPPIGPELVSSIRFHYALTVEVGATTVATSTLTRVMGSPTVTASEVAVNGVLGQLYMPAGPGPFPAVVMLAGSGGGLLRRVPKVIAAHGYAVLSLAYFDYTSPVDGSSLPSDTHELPLEYFSRAIDWLVSRPGVDSKRVGVIGYSLGGQVALLTAAYDPRVKAVIGLSAPTVTWDWGNTTSSFSFAGKPIPWANALAIDSLDGGYTDAIANGKDPLAVMPAVLAKVKGDAAIAAAIIPAERVRGSILLVSGTEDSQLPGPVYAELLIDRLKTAGFTYPYRDLIGTGAGHIVDFPYAPRLLEIEDGGGTAQANAIAATVMWPALLTDLAAMH